MIFQSSKTKDEEEKKEEIIEEKKEEIAEEKKKEEVKTKVYFCLCKFHFIESYFQIGIARNANIRGNIVVTLCNLL